MTELIISWCNSKFMSKKIKKWTIMTKNILLLYIIVVLIQFFWGRLYIRFI